MNIIIDKNIPYIKGVAENYGNVTYLPGAEFTKENIKGADALIVRTVAHFDKENLENSKVKIICSATIGFDHIDTEYCDKNNIAWYNAPGCNSSSVQQYIVSALIYISKKYNINLQEKTIGVIGVGNVGSKVAQACKLLGMRVLLNDPPRVEKEGIANFVGLDVIKEKADFITVHTPLNKEGKFKTLHLLDENFFNQLNKKPFIINSARGGIIKTNAIKDALKNKLIAGAIIDCWENEPTIDAEYMNLVDLATPHIAGYSADGKANASRMALENLANFFKLDKSVLQKIQPLEIPNPIIDLKNSKETDLKDRIYYALSQTYDIENDYKKLKSDINSFKTLRNEYPLRREAKAYSIINYTTEEKDLLSKFGFNFK